MRWKYIYVTVMFVILLSIFHASAEDSNAGDKNAPEWIKKLNPEDYILITKEDIANLNDSTYYEWYAELRYPPEPQSVTIEGEGGKEEKANILEIIGVLCVVPVNDDIESCDIVVNVFETPELAAMAFRKYTGYKVEDDGTRWNPVYFRDARFEGGAGESNTRIDDNGAYGPSNSIIQLFVRYRNMIAYFDGNHINRIKGEPFDARGEATGTTREPAILWLDKVSRVAPPPKPEFKVVATVKEVKAFGKMSDITIIRNGKPLSAYKGMELKEGDTLMTRDSAVEIQFPQINPEEYPALTDTIYVYPHSIKRLRSFSKDELGASNRECILETGQFLFTFFWLPMMGIPTYDAIKMKWGSAETEHTQFVCEQTDNESIVKVIEGTVKFTSDVTGEEIHVKAGEMAIANATGLAPVRSFDVDAEKAKWESLFPKNETISSEENGGNGSYGEAEYQILDHSMGKAIDKERKGDQIVDRTSTFSTTDEKMYSWLKFGPTTRSHEVEWIWYSPDGEEFSSGKHTASNPTQSHSAWWWIPLDWNNGKNTASDLPGNWHVDISIDGRHVLTENFVIEAPRKTNGSNQPIEGKRKTNQSAWVMVNITSQKSEEAEHHNQPHSGVYVIGNSIYTNATYSNLYGDCSGGASGRGTWTEVPKVIMPDQEWNITLSTEADSHGTCDRSQSIWLRCYIGYDEYLGRASNDYIGKLPVQGWWTHDTPPQPQSETFTVPSWGEGKNGETKLLEVRFGGPGGEATVSYMYVFGQPSCDWSGKWKDSDGDTWNLQQSGNVVTGSYTHDDGRIQGQIVAGTKLVGAWSEAPSYGPPRDSGEFMLVISSDCKHFWGQWMYADDQKWRGGWSGTRIEETE